MEGAAAPETTTSSSVERAQQSVAPTRGEIRSRGVRTPAAPAAVTVTASAPTRSPPSPYSAHTITVVSADPETTVTPSTPTSMHPCAAQRAVPVPAAEEPLPVRRHRVARLACNVAHVSRANGARKCAGGGGRLGQQAEGRRRWFEREWPAVPVGFERGPSVKKERAGTVDGNNALLDHGDKVDGVDDGAGTRRGCAQTEWQRT
eukprot:4028642-Pleurochrysis_carterae.AAC.1